MPTHVTPPGTRAVDPDWRQKAPDVSKLAPYFRDRAQPYALAFVAERLAYHRAQLDAYCRQKPLLTASTVREALMRAEKSLAPLLVDGTLDYETAALVVVDVAALLAQLQRARARLPKRFPAPHSDLLRFTVPWLRRIYEQCGATPGDERALRRFVRNTLEIADLPRPDFDSDPRALTGLLNAPLLTFTDNGWLVVPSAPRGDRRRAIRRWQIL